MSAQAWFFLATAAAGFVCGFAYDALRLLRKAVRHPNALVQVEDALFWASAAALCLYVTLVRGIGTRWFVPVGALAGMAVYAAGLPPVWARAAALISKKVLRRKGEGRR